MGNLRISSINLLESVRAGVARSVLDQGVGQWAGTPEPGTDGNIVLAGHRTTWSRRLYDLDHLRRGDVIYMTDSDGIEILYRVSRTFIVDPQDMWITFDGKESTLTMFACHPKGSLIQRIVVVAHLVSKQRVL